MSLRTKVLLILGAAFGANGLALALSPQTYASSSYTHIFSVMDPQLWALIFFVTSAAALSTVMQGKGERAAWALLGFVSFSWAVGFTIGVVDGSSMGPSGSIIWSSIAALSFVTAADKAP